MRMGEVMVKREEERYKGEERRDSESRGEIRVRRGEIMVKMDI